MACTSGSAMARACRSFNSPSSISPRFICGRGGRVRWGELTSARAFPAAGGPRAVAVVRGRQQWERLRRRVHPPPTPQPLLPHPRARALLMACTQRCSPSLSSWLSGSCFRPAWYVSMALSYSCGGEGEGRGGGRAVRAGVESAQASLVLEPQWPCRAPVQQARGWHAHGARTGTCTPCTPF